MGTMWTLTTAANPIRHIAVMSMIKGIVHSANKGTNSKTTNVLKNKVGEEYLFL